MGQLIKHFPDGSFLEYDRGGFDDWCVYLTDASGKRKPPRDIGHNCFDLSVLGLSMGTNMKADLCIQTLENALTAYPALEGAIIHSDRGTQYTSESYRQTIREHHIHQSMNSAGGRCHDNARCESMWARMKTELLYDRYDTRQMTVEELKALIWRYFLSYWNNRRICSANGGLPPMIKRRQYYEALELVA